MDTELIESLVLQLPNFAGLIIAILVLHRELRHANDRADRYYEDCVSPDDDRRND